MRFSAHFYSLGVFLDSTKPVSSLFCLTGFSQRSLGCAWPQRLKTCSAITPRKTQGRLLCTQLLAASQVSIPSGNIFIITRLGLRGSRVYARMPLRIAPQP